MSIWGNTVTEKPWDPVRPDARSRASRPDPAGYGAGGGSYGADACGDCLIFEVDAARAEAIAQDAAASRPFAGGAAGELPQAADPGRDGLALVALGDQGRRFLPWTGRLRAGSGEKLYVVRFSPLEALVGLDGLVSYRVPAATGCTFKLGFYASLRLRAAHVAGLQVLLADKSRVSADEAMRALRPMLCREAAQAVRAVMGAQVEPYDYNDIRARRHEIAAAVERAAFEPCFEHGVCIEAGSLEIVDFARPFL